MTTPPLTDGREGAQEPLPAARRRLRARLSSGHYVMLLAGLLAMLLNYQVLRAADDTTLVAVVGRDVAAGQPLSREQVRLVEIVAGGDLLSTLVTGERLDLLDGQVAGTDLRGGSLLRRTDLRQVAAPDGLRAMSIPVDADQAAGGRVEAGDRIDVIEVRDGGAEYLLVDTPVLAVDSPEVRAGIAASRAFSITVAVDAEQALRLALAIREGSLAVLRSTGAPPPTVTRVERSPTPQAGSTGGRP